MRRSASRHYEIASTVSTRASAKYRPVARSLCSEPTLSIGHVARSAAIASFVALAALGYTGSADAQWLVSGDKIRVTYGPTAYHFSHSDEHVRFNHMLSVELLSTRWTRWGADRSQIGFAALDNSFGQFSQYAYVGQEWDVWRVLNGDVYINVTAGLLHGYKEPYEDKIPFNQLGIAPVIIPSIGWRYRSFAVMASVLGANGFLFGASWTFDAVR